MAGRIETYMHSDSSTPNKGVSIVEVACETDFAAKTVEFIKFTSQVAKMSYACSAQTWKDVVDAYPEMEQSHLDLEKTLKERIKVMLIRQIKLGGCK